MLFKKDENKLIKELREEIDELIYGKEVNNLINYQLERRVEELQKEVNFLKLREAGFEERLKEQLESYEEKLKQRDLKISSMELLHEQLEEQIESLEEELEKASEESTPLTPEVICGMSTEDIQRFAEIFVEALKKESEDDSTHEYTKDTIRFSATFNGKTFLAPYPDTVANHIDKVMNLSSDGYQRVVEAFQKLSDSMYGQDTTNGFENSIHVNVFSMRLERFVIITLGLSKKAEWTII